MAQRHGRCRLFAAGGGSWQRCASRRRSIRRINAGLAAAGFPPGTSLYAQFFRDAQAIVDAGDGCNYVGELGRASPRSCRWSRARPEIATRPHRPGASRTPRRCVSRVCRAADDHVATRAASATRRARGYVNFIDGGHGIAAVAAASGTAQNPDPRRLVPTSGHAPQLAAFLQSGHADSVTNSAILAPQ